jgi:hypothetical protein
MYDIEPENSKFKIYDPMIDILSDLDFTQNDGSDPLLVDKYTKNHLKEIGNIKNIKAYLVKHEEKIIAFFTLRMTLIRSNNLSYYDKDEFKGFNSPALLMDKIGIDKKYRCFKIGKYICLFCLGLAQKTNENQPCTFFIFKTTKSLAEKIYGPKYHFKWKRSDNKLVWIYRKII